MQIKELFDICPKSKRSASFGKERGKYPFFTSSNTIDKFVDEPDYIGEYLIIGDGGTGNVKYYNGEFSASDHNYLLKPKSNCNPRCVRYFLKKDGHKILNDGFKGSGIQNVSKKYVQEINYHFNQKYTERQIVSSLEKIETEIEYLDKIIFYLDSLVKSLFVEMFGTIDLSLQSSTWKELGSICHIYTGTTPSSSDESNWGGDILWITPAEMKNDSFYICDTERKITEKGRKSKSLQIMPVNTVLLSTRAPIGKTGIVGKPMTCNQGFKNFECGPLLNPIFLYILLKNNTEFLNSLGAGTTFKEISKSKAEKIRVPIQPIELQNKFASIVSLIDKSRFVIQEEIKDLQELFDSKMDEYFGGDEE